MGDAARPQVRSQWSSYEWFQTPDGQWDWQWKQPPRRPSGKAWTCAHCGTSNEPPKTKCAHCGLRKNVPPQQVGHSSKGGAKGSSQQPSNSSTPPTSVTTQLGAVADRLAAATAPDEEPQAPTASGNAPLSRDQHQAALRQLDAALAAISADDPACAEIRATLVAQQDTHRAAIMEQQPIGQRLDSAQSALLRARKRLNQALEAQDLARKTVDTARPAV